MVKETFLKELRGARTVEDESLMDKLFLTDKEVARLKKNVYVLFKRNHNFDQVLKGLVNPSCSIESLIKYFEMRCVEYDKEKPPTKRILPDAAENIIKDDTDTSDLQKQNICRIEKPSSTNPQEKTFSKSLFLKKTM